jgi:hypothetical protein
LTLVNPRQEGGTEGAPLPRDDAAGCFDAFTIVLVDGEERVADDFCR